MCGIIGIIGKGEAAPVLLDGLKRLEYRGYDSAGIATLSANGIERRRAEGKLVNLDKRLQAEPLSGTTGIGHTRWATHGVPNEENAHPHATDKVVIVHNGIIENFQELKDEVMASGAVLASQTDTEVVAHLITAYLNAGDSPRVATAKSLKRLRGAFSLGILFSGELDLMIAARRGTPLAIGFGEGEMFLGSDALALAQLTKKIMYLEDGDWAVITSAGATVFDEDDQEVERLVRLTELSGATVGKGGYRHFMLKEIYEQPQVIGDTLHSYVNPSTREVSLGDLDIDLAAVSKVTIIACGTAYLAAMVAKYWIEGRVRMSVEVDVASEFRYRAAAMPEDGLALFVSQSGETIHGNSTCLLNYDGATGYLVGDEHRGLIPMFIMMNAARIGVGVQGLSASEVAYQNAADYARDRLQGRSISGAKNPDGPADPIIVHPDVRRMLLEAKAFNEGARALSLWMGILVDQSRKSPVEEDKKSSEELAGLITPVLKGVLTDLGYQNATNCQQVLGGHGYIKEWGMEQFVRDARIAMIYEGANGIQALDLVGRKLAQNGGAGIRAYFELLDEFCTDNNGADMEEYITPLKAAVDDLKAATMWLMENAPNNPDNAGAASTSYMHLMGLVAMGHMWGQMAATSLNKIAEGDGNINFHKNKLITARFYFKRMLPDTAAHLRKVEVGADVMMDLPAEAF